MQNEPNSNSVCPERVEGLRQIAHFYNEKRTMNNEQIQTNPIYTIFRPKTMITKKNEPNFARRTSSIKYPESRFEKKMSNEPNLRQIIHFNNEQRTMNNEQFSNEPNLCPF